MQQTSEQNNTPSNQKYTHDRNNILQSLQRLYKRRTRIESGQFVLRCLLLFCLFLFASSLLLSYSFPKESVYLTLMILSVPLFSYLRKVGDFFEDTDPTHSVARKLEIFEPNFQGNLMVVVENVRGATFLKERAAQKSISTLSHVRTPDFLPLTNIRKLLFYISASICILFVLENQLMIGPSSVWSAFSSGYGVKQKDVKQDDVNIDHEVIIGDITLTYDFPEYTGLGQITVKNSDGTIHAPIGTSVLIQAKSEQNYDAVSFIVNDDEPVAFTLRNNREIEGNIEITKAGTWKFQMSRKNREESKDNNDFLYFSSSYDLEVDGDTPPVVTVDGERDMLTSANRPIPLRWKAKDDYGIERVLVEWVDLDTPLDQELQLTETKIISMPKDTPLFLESKFKLRPDQLGLRAGDEVRLRIVAYDGQAPSEDDVDMFATSSTDENAPIGKRGESIDIIVRVATPEMLGKKLIEFHEKLLDILLDAIAPTLTEPLPIDNISKGDRALRKEMIAHSINIRNRYSDIEQIYREHWGNAPTKDISQELISNILQRTGRLMRLISTTYGEDVSGRIIEQDHKNVREATSELINDHERAIYLIDYMLREIAFLKMRETAQKLSEQGYQFEKRKEQENQNKQSETEKNNEDQNNQENNNSENVDEETFKRNLSREFEDNISLERNIEKLLSFNQKLSSSGIQEYVKSRGEEAQALQQNLKQKLQQVKELDNPDKKALQEIDAMQRQLNQDLQDLSLGIDELFQRQQKEEEDLQQQMEDLIKQLEELQADEERLAEDLALSRKTNDPNRDKLASIWDRIIQITEKNLALHKSVLEDTAGGIGFRSDSISTLERLESHLSKLNNTSRSRDPEKVFRSIEQVERYLYFSQSRIETESNRYRPSNQQKPQNISQILSKLDQISSGMIEIRQLLEQTSKYAQESSYMQQKAKEQLPEQQDLTSKAGELYKGVQKLEAELPTADGSASALMMEAQNSMTLSENYLGQGNSISGEGLQRDAAYKIEAAKEKLLEQQQQMQQMQQQMQQMSSSQQGSGEGSGGEDSEESESMSSSDIPNVEERMSLEEYRRMVLQGLNSKVPEEYESLRRRYFEELIQE